MAPEGTAAMLVCAVQLGAALAGWLVVQLGRTDEYGRPPYAPLGLLCVCVFGPPLLLFLGAVHTALMTMPSDLVAQALARRAKGALWQWRCAAPVVIGAAYAAALAAAGAPFLSCWAAITASAALPLLCVARFRRGEERRGRPYSLGEVLFRVLPAGLLLTVAVAVACGGALHTGVIGDYAPPRPSKEAMAGVWASEDGPAEVVLRADGGAVLTAMPYDGWEREGRCDGTGTWSYAAGAVEFDVAGEDCQVGAWTVGGTAERPELYVLFGDPDAGDVRILVQQAAP
ncbi:MULTISPECIES: hypothetical protein [unclassified Streptomyces]|uniref:hypothetical protein n=1 Tax=unclassified Streptomyces TaxID=2593676 RepID=UPI00093C3408|nr:hypothetical protein [Streptomyces sp. CB02058]OKI97557.1 hypothetical protein AMK10_01630 [Streptomyces sp. CB02058]